MKLSDMDKMRIKALIDAGEPLPLHYRDALFPLPPEPELIWQGKPVGVQRPRGQLHLLERVRPAADPQSLPGLQAAADPATPGWRNRLLRGDNLAALAALLEGPLRREIDAAGGLKLVYIDPPFDAGTDFGFKQRIGGADSHASTSLRHAAYRDRWGRGADSYLSMMVPRLRLIHELLCAEGSLYVHCDWRVNGALRVLLEEIFGRANFVNEIVWHYYNKYSTASRHLPRAHDSVLVFSKAGRHTFHPLRIARDEPRRQLVRTNVAGTLKNARDSDGRLMYRVVADMKADDVWRLPQLQPASAQWSGYETQKHHGLLERIIRMGSDPGDLVGDFFCGSGTTLAVAEKLQRRWIGCDASPHAMQVTRKRLLFAVGARNETTTPPPFDILAVSEAGAEPPPPEPACGAPALALRVGAHGHAVRIAIDGITVPPTLDAEGLQDALAPGRETLLAADGNLYRVARTQTGELVRTRLTMHWQDWLDAWSVDFDATPRGAEREPEVAGHQAEPDDSRAAAPAAATAAGAGEESVFRGHWHAARTRRRRDLPLQSDIFVYPGTGHYRIAVKAWDILGREILQTLEVTV